MPVSPSATTLIGNVNINKANAQSSITSPPFGNFVLFLLNLKKYVYFTQNTFGRLLLYFMKTSFDILIQIIVFFFLSV